MTKLKSCIKNLRIYSLLLFLIPLTALMGSLLFSNYLFHYGVHYNFPLGKTDANIYQCTYENHYCAKLFKEIEFHKCSKYYIHKAWYLNGKVPKDFYNEKGKFYYWTYVDFIAYPEFIYNYNNRHNYLSITELKAQFKKEGITKLEYKVLQPNLEKIDHACVKNSIFYPIFEKFPSIGKIFLEVRTKSIRATSYAVFPFIDGKTSISNIVKRYPQSYFFKPLLYLSSILMILYWISYKKIFSIIEKANNTKKIEFFLIFGILSSIFLFLHVFFLGTDIDTSIAKKLRRLIIMLFIFCELIAQFFLAKRIFTLKDILFNYTYKVLIYLKITYVATILLLTVIAVSILSFFDPGKTFNNILEWNYFLFLLIFYLLSAMMWRRNIKK